MAGDVPVWPDNMALMTVKGGCLHHPIFWNRAMESVIESQSSDGGSHDLCRGSQYGDLAFDRSFPLPHGYFPVNPHGIGRWYDAVKDRIGKGTASQSFMPAFRHEL